MTDTAPVGLPAELATDPDFRKMFVLAATRLIPGGDESTLAVLEAICALAYSYGDRNGARDVIARMRALAALDKASGT